MGEYRDYMVRATAANNQIRAFAVTSRDLVEQARSYHNTSPVITAALGRLLTGGVMMGCMMGFKKERDLWGRLNFFRKKGNIILTDIESAGCVLVPGRLHSMETDVRYAERS